MYSCHAPKSVVRLGVRSRPTTGQWAVLVCNMEDSVEDRLAEVSRKLLRGTRVYAVDWCHTQNTYDLHCAPCGCRQYGAN